MAKIEVTSDKSSARAAQREDGYQEADDLGREAQRVTDSAWNAGRSMIGDSCGLLSQFVIAFGRALAPSGYYSQQRPAPGGDYYAQQRRESGSPVVEPRSDTKLP